MSVNREKGQQYLVPPSILEVTLPGLTGNNAVPLPLHEAQSEVVEGAEKIVPREVFMKRRSMR